MHQAAAGHDTLVWINIANAGWAHAIGVACLFCFVVLAFSVIILTL